MLLHVFSSTVGHVLVKSPQQDGAHHDCDVEPEASQEAAALQGHVRRPDNQGLSRAVRQREEVVTSQQREGGFSDQSSDGVKNTGLQLSKRHYTFSKMHCSFLGFFFLV